MTIFQEEYRNISEILVHTLDLNYFYKGNITNYILLIWSSWAPLPNTKVDIRQYILRSLLSIASTLNQDLFDRFEISVNEFKKIIKNNNDKLIDTPLFKELLTILENQDLMTQDYFGAFKNSVILVDMVKQIFFSTKVNVSLWNDENVISETVKGEDLFYYDLPLDFIN